MTSTDFLTFGGSFLALTRLAVQTIAAGAGDWTAYDAVVAGLGTIGEGDFSTSQVIARWNVVPWQTHTGTVRYGVLAYHVGPSDVARVDFYLDGGSAFSVTSRVVNSRTGCAEFCVDVPCGSLADGTHEIRAIAYPAVGLPRALDAITFSANSGGTLTSSVRYVSTTGDNGNDGLTAGAPMADIGAAAYSLQAADGAADGGTIYLLAGTYAIPGTWVGQAVTTNRWLTITRAPGVARSSAVVSGSTGSGLNVKLLRLYDVTLTGGVNSGGPLVDYIWIDSLTMVGAGEDGSAGGTSPVPPKSSWTGMYATDCALSNATVGFQSFNITRGCSIDGIGGDCYSNTLCVANCTATDVAYPTAPGGVHADIWQCTGVSSSANIVLYKLFAVTEIGETQGIAFNAEPTGVALVDSHLEVGDWDMSAGYTNVLIKDSTLIVRFADSSPLVAVDVVLDNVTELTGSNTPVTSGVTER